MGRLWAYVTIGVGVALGGVLPASAGFFDSVYQGLSLVATPSGSPVSTNGAGEKVNGARVGRLRIVPNTLGNGYRLELDRTFGVDSTGRAETFDTGPVSLTLSGTTQTTLGFTRRGGLSANANTTINALNYQAQVKPVLGGGTTGTVSGVLNLNNSLQINALGFYTLDVNVTNTQSTVTFDTLSGGDQKNLNFDIGPINVRGNVFLDALTGALSAAGVDTTQLEQLSGRSGIDQFNAAVQQALAQQGLALDGSVNVTNGGTAATAKASNPLNAASAQTGSAVLANTVTAPEPAALLLLACGALLLRRR